MSKTERWRTLPDQIKDRLEQSSGVEINSDQALSSALDVVLKKSGPDMGQKLREIEAKAIRKLRAGSAGAQCSFCGKSENQVSELFPGRDAYICNNCVEELRRL